TLLSSAPSPSSSTELGFRFSQDDFLLKMPVVMLRSVGDLLRYIDENHLTSDFTGKVEYCHSDWIVLRTAIESFAVTVKEIAQLLQGFGSELSDTELPDEANAIEFLLHSHTHRYRQMKVVMCLCFFFSLLTLHLQAVSLILLFRCLIRSLPTCVQMCFRLLAQLRDMEEAFDGFFEKHHLKLQQYLQLLHYEMSFQQMDEVLERLSAQEKGIASVGTTVVQTEQLLRDLEILDTQEEMARAQVVILHGHQLAANHHYALALIIQRCNELRHHCDVITTAIRTKQASLTRLILHKLMRSCLLFVCVQAMHWCNEGAYLLASQMVDKFQTREGAQEALQYLTCHQERAPSALKNSHSTLSLEFEAILTPQLQSQIAMVTDKLNSVQSMIRNRVQCLRKLADVQVRPIQTVTKLFGSYDTSSPLLSSPLLSSPLLSSPLLSSPLLSSPLLSSLVSSPPLSFPLLPSRFLSSPLVSSPLVSSPLLSSDQGYRAEMEDPSMSNLLPSALRSQKDVLFGNMPEIYQFHSRIFLQDLQGCLETPERVGACFLQRKEKFQVYERYCQNKPRSELLWRQCSDSPFFQECQRKLDHKLGLDSYLLKPVQRLTKYQLLLKELLKHCTEELYRCELQEALDSMLELLKSVNDSMHQTAITGYQGDLSQLGRMVMQGGFSVWISHKRAAVRMKEMARFKPMQRHLFLYEHALLFCKRRDEDTHDRTPFYSFKSCLRMSAVGITETVKGDVKKFEIWYSGREVVYIVQAPTVEVKVAWLTEIRKILTNQQKVNQDQLYFKYKIPAAVSLKWNLLCFSEETPSLPHSDAPLSDRYFILHDLSVTPLLVCEL
uniref:MCF.2 cell line derived transforming sequence b n=1 Tax=Sphaeramia orbicularis TaxID=375764 RepID=A0A673A2Z6_9TELE